MKPDIEPKAPPTAQQRLEALAQGAMALQQAGKLDDSIGFIAITIGALLVTIHAEQQDARDILIEEIRALREEIRQLDTTVCNN